MIIQAKPSWVGCEPTQIYVGAVITLDHRIFGASAMEGASDGHNAAYLLAAEGFVLLAVLPANLMAQKHDRRLPKPWAVSRDTWSAPQAVSVASGVPALRISKTYRYPAVAKFLKTGLSCESWAKQIQTTQPN
jgi:hypothetical protein